MIYVAEHCSDCLLNVLDDQIVPNKVAFQTPIYYYDIYPHGFAHPRHRACIGVLTAPKHSKINKNGPKWNPKQDKFKPKQSLEAPWGLLGELMGPKRHRIPKHMKNEAEKCEMVDAGGPLK